MDDWRRLSISPVSVPGLDRESAGVGTSTVPGISVQSRRFLFRNRRGQSCIFTPDAAPIIPVGTPIFYSNSPGLFLFFSINRCVMT